jgi:hypothetical protein
MACYRRAGGWLWKLPSDRVAASAASSITGQPARKERRVPAYHSNRQSYHAGGYAVLWYCLGTSTSDCNISPIGTWSAIGKQKPWGGGLIGAVNWGAHGISTAVCGIIATISSFFVEATSGAGFSVFLSHEDNMQGGRMTVSTLILILLLTFAAAGALERLRSTLIK